MSSEILAQQLNSSTAVKSTDFNSELRFDKQKVIMRVEIAISNFANVLVLLRIWPKLGSVSSLEFSEA